MSNFSSTYPAIRPTYQIDFSNGKRIPPNATFSRSDTPPTYAAPSAVHFWSNEKHESSQNLILQSQSYDTTWTTYQLASSGALTGSQSAPDGTTTAWLVTAGTHTSGSPFLNQALSGISNSTEYTVSAYLKAGTASHGYISLRGQYGHIAWAEIDFASPLSPASGGANFTSISATSTAVGSTGWYRLTLTCTTSTVTAASTYVGPSDGTDPSLYGYAIWNCSGETIYVWGHQIEQRGSVTAYNPTTTQIHREYAPTLKSVATAGQPRFEYDPSTDGQSMGILIEGASTNLNPYSDDISSWSLNTRITTTSNAAVGPDGTLGADLIVGTGSSSHYARSAAITVSSGTTYTLSGYFKSVNGEKIRLLFYQTGSPYTHEAGSVFTLTGNGSVVTTDGSATITPVGNGYYRCTVTGTTLSTSSFVQIQTYSTDGSETYVANGYNGILCAGIQFELGSHASSLISTSGSAVTRAAESLSVTDSSLFGTGSGSVVVEAGPVNGTFYPTLFDLTDTTTSNRVLLQSGGTGTPTSLTVAADGNASVGVVSEAVTMSDRKFAVSYDTNSFKLVNNGGAVSEDTSGQLPKQLSKLNIGTDNGGGGPLNGNIKRIAVFGEPLSDSNLQAITS